MGLINTKGIVIKESNCNDFDKVVTFLTPDLGQITCFAKGARKPNNGLLAGTSFFAFSDIVLFKGAGSYKLNSCNTIELFYNLRVDLDKLNYAIAITKIIRDVTNENEQNYNILRLYLNTLYMISESEKNINQIVATFKFKLTCILGFMPNLSNCTNCNIKENLKYFSFKDNGVKCNNCGSQDKGVLLMSSSTYNALRYIIKSDSKQLYNFKLKDNSLKELEIISNIYLNEKIYLY